MQKNWFPKDYKILRDAVHGDIIIENRYIAVISTKEFQRLRRIRQLSIASLIFPSADHTRFSHSIGTFYVMKKMITQISKQLSNLKYDISERDKDVALLAALLHDIGHGPFSHAFENIFSNMQTHEHWTVDIIKNKKTSIHQVLCIEFDENMPNDVANLIEKNTIKKIDDSNRIFYNVLSSLISSQIDADRLDYLLRDSYHAGVIFGNIDLNRIISAIHITIYDRQPVVYIQEKYLTDIEEYLFSRYQMNKSVYYHPIKLEFEEIIRLIFTRVRELIDDKKLEYTPEYINKISNNKLSIAEYCDLDESTLTSDFKIWMKSKDKVLSKLCTAYINREKFTKVRILDGKQKNIDDFKKELFQILQHYKLIMYNKNIKYFWIEKYFEFTMYKSNKENILVLNKLGKMQDITEISSVFSNSQNDIVNKYTGIYTYINYDILEYLVIEKKNECIQEVRNLVDSYDSRNHIEIENKYLLNELSFDEIEKFLAENYHENFKQIDCCEQIDTYYDTLKREFYEASETIRIRKRKSDYIFTIKTPVSKTDTDLVENKNERFEYEKKICSDDIASCYDYIKEKSTLGKDITTEFVAPLLIIKNKRKKFELEYKNTILEISFDDFSYHRDISQESYFSQKQIEIELKSDYSKKILLESFCIFFEEKFPCIHKTVDSKLKIGMSKLND